MGKAIVARFDAAFMSSDGGLLALREVEQRLAIAQGLADCIHGARDPSRVIRGLDEIIRTRMRIIAAGYEDGNDASSLRSDPMFESAMGLDLEQSIAARAAAITGGTKLRRFKRLHDGAGSWYRVEPIVARVQAGPKGTDTRFIVTSLHGPSGRIVYQDIYRARGQAENSHQGMEDAFGRRAPLGVGRVWKLFNAE